MHIDISATSALVMNWTDPRIWNAQITQDYLRQLDLSAGQPLMKLFRPDEHFMHTQTISSRKYFILNEVSAFLEAQQRKGRQGQVLILAAGLAPMSLELASRFPASRIFDVDRYQMREKQQWIGDRLSNIRCIECDITDVRALELGLRREGYRPEEPVIAVLEGIIYYLTTDALRGLLGCLSAQNAVVVGEFGLVPEHVEPATRFFLENVFAKIREQARLDFITFYSDESLKDVFQQAGFSTVTLTNFQGIQKKRTGDIAPFPSPESSWIKAFTAS